MVDERHPTITTKLDAGTLVHAAHTRACLPSRSFCGVVACHLCPRALPFNVCCAGALLNVEDDVGLRLAAAECLNALQQKQG